MWASASNKFYCNAVRASDTATTYILGSASTYGTPLFSGGSSNISLTSSSFVCQTFAILTYYNSTGTTQVRNVLTSVSNFY
jgi:hypothetical protein